MSFTLIESLPPYVLYQCGITERSPHIQDSEVKLMTYNHKFNTVKRQPLKRLPDAN
jgi:hypothetical protein